MQSLIERALVNEKNDVQALRDLEATISAEGDEPTPRIMTDGGHPRPTAGWRSPLGGPRYDGPIPGGDRSVEWSEDRVEAAIEEREKRLEERKRAEAVAGPEDDGLRADGGENAHASRVAEQLAMADAEGEDEALEPIHVGDHVRDRDDEDGATMLVVGTPIEVAEEYECNGQTIADYNEDYPADDDVLEVVFPSRADVSTRPLSRYAYPRSRLEVVAQIHDDGGDE